MNTTVWVMNITSRSKLPPLPIGGGAFINTGVAQQTKCSLDQFVGPPNQGNLIHSHITWLNGVTLSDIVHNTQVGVPVAVFREMQPQRDDIDNGYGSSEICMSPAAHFSNDDLWPLSISQFGSQHTLTS